MPRGFVKCPRICRKKSEMCVYVYKVLRALQSPFSINASLSPSKSLGALQSTPTISVGKQTEIYICVYVAPTSFVKPLLYMASVRPLYVVASQNPSSS